MRRTVSSYVRILRPHQWLKNLLLLFPPFFAGKIHEPSVLSSLVPALLSFCLASSCCYIINDIKDREFDSRHISKRNRPIARGDVSIQVAAILAAFLYLAAMLLAGAVLKRFEGYLTIYFFLSILYTMYFKNIVIADMFFIAFGFLIRVLAGGEAFQVSVSGWLLLTVFLVAMFLAAGKRLGELISMNETAGDHRQNLREYSDSFLEGILWFSASATLVTYALYTLERKSDLFYTVPLAAFGLLRFIYVAKKGKGDPTEALLMDGQIVGVAVMWSAMIGIIIYK